jgi:hypothetical protein
MDKQKGGEASHARNCPNKYLEIGSFQEILKHMSNKPSGISVFIQYKDTLLMKACSFSVGHETSSQITCCIKLDCKSHHAIVKH